MNYFELNLEVTTPIYVPILSNKVQYAISIDDDGLYPYCIGGIGFVNNQGKLNHQENPVVFPYTQESYDKLKVVYPNLEPYKTDAEQLMDTIINEIGSCLVRHESSNTHKIIYVTVLKDKQIAFYNKAYRELASTLTPVNPYSLQPVNSLEEYLQVPDLEIPF